jgi:hypothetical protein
VSTPDFVGGRRGGSEKNSENKIAPNILLGVILKILMVIVLSISFFVTAASAQSDYKAIHKESLVVDMHADVLLHVLRGADISKRIDYGHIDLIRLKEGGIGVQFFAI